MTNKWHPMTERPPAEICIVYDGTTVTAGLYNNDLKKWHILDPSGYTDDWIILSDKVTHWMLLPEAHL